MSNWVHTQRLNDVLVSEESDSLAFSATSKISIHHILE